MVVLSFLLLIVGIVGFLGFFIQGCTSQNVLLYLRSF